MKLLDEKFEITKEYVRENPNANIQLVAEECEVSVAQIKRWVREERLTFSEDSQIGVECEGCGKMIRTGRFCDSCKTRMANQFQNLYEKPKVEPKKKEKEKDKMRFLDN